MLRREAGTSPRAELSALVTVAGGFAFLAWLRWPEPPGLDQSLFVLYGHWLGRGSHLYADLWDSKPPGLFLLYAVAEQLAGIAHSAWLLDTLASGASAVLAWRLVRPAGSLAAVAAATLACLLPAVPGLGGPLVAGQAEVLMAPLLLGAALAAGRRGARAGAAAGMLLGAAACLKLVGLLFVPLAWIFAPPGERRALGRGAATLAGLVLGPAACATWLARQGTLDEAFRAVCVYPRAYAAEIDSRMRLLPALGRGLGILTRALPFTLALAAAGATLEGHRDLTRRLLLWLVLAGIGVSFQRQMAGYQLLLLAPPLALLGGLGAQRLGHRLVSWLQRIGSRASLAWMALPLAASSCVAALEAGPWVRHYTAHLRYRGGTPRQIFLQRLGTPGRLWLDAEAVAAEVRREATLDHTMLVWGLAPAVYALSECRPATRYAFHQTLLVADSPLSNRWPGCSRRRAELLQHMQQHPPGFIVVVRGDRSGLELSDSETELQAFGDLERLLRSEYRVRESAGPYTLWVRGHETP